MSLDHGAVLEAVKRTGSFAQVAKEYSVTREGVRQIVRRYEPELDLEEIRTELQKAEILAAIAQGACSVAEISEKISLSEAATSNRVRRLGIEIPERPDEMVGRQFDLWEVIERVYRQPDGSYSPVKSNFCLTIYYWCKCRGCGREKPVQKRNILNHRSHSCHKCGIKRRSRRVKVINTVTKEKFDSVLDAANSVGISNQLFNYYLSKGKPIGGAVWRRVKADESELDANP